MDVQVPAETTDRLRIAGVDVLTAQEDGQDRTPDVELLDRMAILGREIFTLDHHFLAEGRRRQREGISFRGVFYAVESKRRWKLWAEWLETYAKLSEPQDVAGRVVFIP